MLRPDTLEADRAMLLLIDVQEKLLPMILDRPRVVASSRLMVEGAALFDLPVLVTEQYPKGLGRTEASILAALSKTRFTLHEKPTFSACGCEPIREEIARLDRPQIVLAGIEAHVCVQQTALDLCVQDYDVFVCADAVGSRGTMSCDMALHRMRQAGARVTTVESVLFELCHRCDAPKFKAMLELIKAFPPA